MKIARSRFSTTPRDRRMGFTLIEVMIVLVIIGLIAGAVGFGVIPKLKKGKIAAAQITVGKIQNGAVLFMNTSNGSCPKGIEDLVTQGDILKSQLKDPWGTPYVLKCPGTNSTDGVDVSSAGPDKQPGTADDINSWEIQ